LGLEDDRISKEGFVNMSYSSTINLTLRPKELRTPLVIDLFAGCGGLALGFEAQGFETLGYEMNPIAVSTYRKNLKGECVEGLLDLNTRYPSAKVIIGGPPCQPFSVIGKQKGREDERDGFPIFIEAIRQVNPEIWMFENVRGVFYRNKSYLRSIIDTLRGFNYIVEYRLLNAVDYGVPQNRERVFVVGHRGNFRFPVPVERKVTAGDAIGDLAVTAPPGSKFLTESMERYIKAYEKKSCCINPRDLALDRPARTLTCRNLAGSTSDMQRVKLPDGRRRRLLVKEAARLQSFPDWFVFEGTESSVYNQIGNAVPPMLSYHLAGCIRSYLESEIRLSPGEISEIKCLLSVQPSLF